MDKDKLEKLLYELIETWENEVVEFKDANDNFKTDKIGCYFSALANEANLRNIDSAWLIFGVDNKTRKIIGTDYRLQKERLQMLKMQISENSEPSITLREIHELQHEKGRVLFLEIPAAPSGLPISWNGHYYSRSGESLTALGIDKQDIIRQQTSKMDWTAQIVPEATFEHLNEKAVKQAKSSFIKKYANRFDSDEIEKWSIETFLNRAKLAVDGKITRTTLLLLGKKESSHLLLPHPAQLTWKLVSSEQAYEHFGPPFLLTTTALYKKIRNFQVRILPNDALIPIEVSKYDQKIVLEALHNCIAHQDYSCNARIIVTEIEDKLTFENEGAFYEGCPEDYITGSKTPRSYRNTFLAQAMTELNMIDTMGYGIFEMHQGQAKRYFPLPDYDLTETGVVKITIYGKIVDPAYSRLLIEKSDLSLEIIMALDRVQKKLPIDNEVIKKLRQDNLIEGRKPNLYVSSKIAKVTGNKVDYIKNRVLDDDYYEKLVIDYLHEFEKATRKEINELLYSKLSENFDEEKKTNKVANLLTRLRRAGKIHNTASKKAPVWKINAE